MQQKQVAGPFAATQNRAEQTRTSCSASMFGTAKGMAAPFDLDD